MFLHFSITGFHNSVLTFAFINYIFHSAFIFVTLVVFLVSKSCISMRPIVCIPNSFDFLDLWQGISTSSCEGKPHFCPADFHQLQFKTECCLLTTQKYICPHVWPLCLCHFWMLLSQQYGAHRHLNISIRCSIGMYQFQWSIKTSLRALPVQSHDEFVIQMIFIKMHSWG